MDAAVTRYLTLLIGQEIPLRFGNFFFPLADQAENYPSLISNMELHSLMVHQYSIALKSGLQTWVDLLGRIH
jgi:ubiquinone biosynthesis protein